MKTNIGNLDRTVRLVLGLLLLSATVLVQGDARWLGVIGVVPIATALFRWCPLYTLLGLSTGNPISLGAVLFKNILVAIDGSATAERGLKTAIKLAAEQGARLHVLHVVDERAPIMYPEAGYYLDEIITSLRDGGKELLARAQRRAATQLGRVKTRLAESMSLPISDIIIREAKKARADLLVLGTHGRRGLGRLVMGSDAEGVVRGSAVPVLLVRGPAVRPRKSRKPATRTKRK